MQARAELSPLQIKSIGKRLRETRKKRALAQVDIAEACNTSIAAVSLWERGRSLANSANLKLAADRLGVDVDWLLTGHKSLEPKELPTHYDPALARKTRRARNGVTEVVKKHESHTDSVSIPEMSSGIGAGSPFSGAGHTKVHGWWSLPTTLIASLRIKPDQLKVFPVLTDSFAPKIARGSLVFVCLEQTVPVDGGIFVIDIGHSIILKKIHVSSANPKTIGLSNAEGEVDTILARKLNGKIIGRVIGQFASL